MGGTTQSQMVWGVETATLEIKCKQGSSPLHPSQEGCRGERSFSHLLPDQHSRAANMKITEEMRQERMKARAALEFQA